VGVVLVRIDDVSLELEMGLDELTSTTSSIRSKHGFANSSKIRDKQLERRHRMRLVLGLPM
jgi:hypothetical protein